MVETFFILARSHWASSSGRVFEDLVRADLAISTRVSELIKTPFNESAAARFTAQRSGERGGIREGEKEIKLGWSEQKSPRSPMEDGGKEGPKSTGQGGLLDTGPFLDKRGERERGWRETCRLQDKKVT